MLRNEEINIIREVVIQAKKGDPEAQKIIDDIEKASEKENRSAGNTTA